MMGGMPPPQPQAPPQPPPGPPGGLGPGSPFGALFTDLSVEMTTAWQLIDVGVRCLKLALKTKEFQKSELNKVNAVIRTTVNSLTTLIAHYASASVPGTKAATATPEEPGDDGGSLQSPDADSAPESDQ